MPFFNGFSNLIYGSVIAAFNPKKFKPFFPSEVLNATIRRGKRRRVSMVSSKIANRAADINETEYYS